MKSNWYRMHTTLLAVSLMAALVPFTSQAKNSKHNNSTNEGFQETILVANDTGTNSLNTDSDLVNPWGLIAGDKSIWVNNNGSDTLTVYTTRGKPFKQVVNVPSPGAPTGIALNDSSSFVITNSSSSSKHGASHAPADFLIATEGGQILAWSQSLSTTSAVVVIDASGSGAIYKGLAIVRSDTNDAPFIYAANFASGNIDVFDGNFNYVTSFTDEDLPGLYAPFNIRNIQGRLFVTYAHKASPLSVDDDPGDGHGFVDIFDTDGTVLRQFAAHGALNSPWGLALAPSNFGRFSNALLVGNFGDGHINAYDLLTGKYLGNLTTSDGDDLVISGLWGLDFDSEESFSQDFQYSADVLYFTAGPNDESDGLLGTIQALSPNLPRAR